MIRLSLLSLALLSISMPTHAGSITYATHEDSVSQAGFVPLFDCTLGTLCGVNFAVSGDAGANTYEPSIPNMSGDAGGHVNFSFSAKDQFNPMVLSLPLSGTWYSDAAGRITVDIAFDGSCSDAGLPDMIGPGILYLQVYGNIEAPGVTPGLSFFGADEQVTYLYTTPEPSAIVLASIAAIILAFTREFARCPMISGWYLRRSISR